MGLLVNEPSDNVGGGDEQDDPGTAHPQANEIGEYLLEFPRSAAGENTSDIIDGSYIWLILHNGKVKPAYQGTDNNFYTGYADTYP